MVTGRRGIHSKDSHEDETKQVLGVCFKCHKKIFEGSVESEKLEDDPGINYENKAKSQTSSDISGKRHVLCKECAIITTNQENEFEFREFLKQQRSLLMVIKLKRKIILPIFLVIFAFGLKVALNQIYEEKTFDVKVKNQTQDEIDFDDELYGIEDIYTKQEERVWYTLAAGIKSVIAEKPNKPSVFLLLYDSDGAGNTAKCLAQDVSKVATKYLMKRENKPLIFSGEELNDKTLLEDPGRLLVRLKDRVAESGAMVVTNLQDVPPTVATSFHYFCDRYSPLVEKAIYFFTLQLQQASGISLLKDAEDTLHNLWVKDMPDNKLHPLITRMVGNVLKITNDNKNCYS